MCKVGDILLIYNAKNRRKPVGMHPFLVLDDTNGIVRGVYKFDFIGLLLTSADTEERKEKLKHFDGNLPISYDDKIMNEGREADKISNSGISIKQILDKATRIEAIEETA